MRRTKIICTMGPQTNSMEMLRELVKNGMNVARFNFSHGDYEEHKQRMDMVKAVREELDTPIALLLDTKGPEIRTGRLEGGQKVCLEVGETVVLTTEDIVGTSERVSINYPLLPSEISAGQRILLDDGLFELIVEQIQGTEITCSIINGGELGEKKGVNVPDVELKLPSITAQDEQDILFGISQNISYVAASFVRDDDAILKIRNLLNSHDGEHIGIIAKIENSQGVRNIDKIIRAADGIMVARGDLGVEIPASQVPYIQKEIIKKCNDSYVPVITATQMLDSMIRNPRPTRAEVADVANAIYDGTDAIMLSGETAAGKYPVEALRMMVEIAETTEEYVDNTCHVSHRSMYRKQNVSSAVGSAAVAASQNIGAVAIVTPTISGRTARLISSFRPEVPIYAITPNESVMHKLQLFWGVTPMMGSAMTTTEFIIKQAMKSIKQRDLVQKGDLIVFTAGDPATNLVTGVGAVTNMMHIIEAL
ncbi:MAG: pyruvate kinase [Lachnospiraceae bacterium]